MLDDPEDLAIVEGVIGLTQAFQRKVIAEGVETVEHCLVLLLLGCDMAQGFGIACPMPADQLPEWIRQFRPDELWSLATAFQWSRDDLPMLIAEVDHKRWIKALHAYLDDRSSQVPTQPLDSHSCRFGHWYYNHNGQRYAHLDSFRAVEATHNDLHETSTRMVRLHEAGKHAEVDAMKPELERLNEQLTACIQEIQAAALMEAQRP